MTFGLGFELRCCLDRQKNRRFYLIVEMTRRSVLIVQGLKPVMCGISFPRPPIGGAAHLVLLPI